VTVVHIIINVTQPCTLVMARTHRAHAHGYWLRGPRGGAVRRIPLQRRSAGCRHYNIGLPVTCECAFINPLQLRARGLLRLVHLHATNVVPRLITDNLPSLCTSWNNYGLGWGRPAGRLPPCPQSVDLRRDHLLREPGGRRRPDLGRHQVALRQLGSDTCGARRAPRELEPAARGRTEHEPGSARPARSPVSFHGAS